MTARTQTAPKTAWCWSRGGAGAGALGAAMKLFFYQATPPNFGDELNRLIWPQLLPGYFNEDAADGLFIGIGSILYDDFPAAPRKIVMGSGYGGYSDVPDVHDGRWQVYFVRGPRTAQALRVDPSLAVCDGAILLRQLELPAPMPSKQRIGFMPHYLSLEFGDWRGLCAGLDLAFIDPAAPPEATIAQIRGLDMLICEAMHGAIVADILRVPWVAARPIDPKNRMKWLDWADALGLTPRFTPLPAASVADRFRRFYRRHPRVQTMLHQGPVAPGHWIDKLYADRARRALVRMMRQEPQLSDDHELDRAADRAATQLDRFKRGLAPA